MIDSAHDELLRAAFAPSRFREEGQEVLGRLVAHLDASLHREGAVLPLRDPREELARWAVREGGVPLLGALGPFLAEVTRLHHPGFVGHQVAPPLPLAALADLASALVNNGMAVYEMGQPGTAIELSLTSWLAGRLGLGPAATGVLTSGGTLANLTAVLAMRQARAGWDVWAKGAHGGPPLAILASEQSHYAIDRAARVLGMGDGIVRVPVDAAYRMDPDRIPEAIARAEADGRRVIGIVASACSTATGSFDPLDAIGEHCAARGLWMHVDGAHGASLALSSKYRATLAGIERADSVVWDAHKLLLQPALVTAVLFRDAQTAQATFRQEASYLLDPAADDAWFDLAGRTFECTKRAMGLGLWLTLAVHGPALLDAYVTRSVDLAKDFAQAIRDSGDFELAVEPACNIVCFRHVPKGLDDAALDALQARLRRRMLEDGQFYLVQTKLGGRTWLRAALQNPFTTPDDLVDLLGELRRPEA